MDPEQTYKANFDGDTYTAFSADAKYEATAGENGKRTLVGYPIVWGALTDEPVGDRKHRFSQGSVEFRKPAFALAHHDYSQPLGDTDSGTLRIAPDAKGMRVEIDVPNTQAGNDTWELVKSGRVKGMSFAGQIKSATTGTPGILDVTKFLAREVTITPIPRFSATSISPAYAKNLENLVYPHKTHDKLYKKRLSELRLASYRNRF